jgi:hypothetical protein
MQDSCLDARNSHPLKSAVPFHLGEKSLTPEKFDWGPPSRKTGIFEVLDNGRFRLDEVLITSMRPMLSAEHVVITSAEVQLTADQSSAVVVVGQRTNERSAGSPLTLSSRHPHTILCRQPLQDEEGGPSAGLPGTASFTSTCSGGSTSRTQCKLMVLAVPVDLLGAD